jgi:hypothetical protein
MTAPTNLWAVKLGAILGIAICRDDLPESARSRHSSVTANDGSAP